MFISNIPQKLLLGFSIAILLLVSVSIISIGTFQTYSNESDLLTLANNSVGDLEKIGSAIINIESNGRGYVISGSEEFLKSNDEAILELNQSLLSLENAMSGTDRIEDFLLLKKKVNERLQITQDHIDLRKNEGLLPAVDEVKKEEGLNKMKELKALLDHIQAQQYQLIEKTRLNQENSRLNTVIVVSLGNGLALLFLILGLIYLNNDIKKRIIVEKELSASNAFQKALVQSTDYAIITTDLNGTISFFNKAAERLTGYTSKELVGKNSPAIFHDPAEIVNYAAELSEEFNTVVKPGFEVFIKRPKTLGIPETREWSYISKNKKKFPVSLIITCITNEGDEVTGYMGVARDISIAKQNELELINAKKIAEKARLAQEQFLANMSHEIRTPMNGVMGMTNLLLATKLSDDQKDCVSAIKESTNNLLIIINDILDISKINAGKMSFEKTSFNLFDLISNVFYTLNFKTSEKNITLKKNIHEGVPEILEGDPFRLSQVLLNLLDNGIKFTEKGQVSLDVRMKERSGSNFRIEFSVEDTGIGIPGDQIDQVFNSFSQASSDITRRYGGTGLGLPISRQLIELQGGKMHVRSVLNKGSVFTFFLDFSEGNPRDKTNESVLSSSFPPADLSHLSILIAEDNKMNQRVVKLTLDRWRINSDIAENGVIAIEKVKAGNYDLILMDLQMPEMDGENATRIIRNEFPEPKKSIPIIAMTASVIRGDYERCVSLGMNDFVSKPFEPKDLYNKIIKHTDSADSEIDRENKKRSPLINLGRLNELSDCDPAFIKEMLNIYLSESNAFLKILSDAVLSENFKSLSKILHKLRSSTALIGAQELTSIINKMEVWAAEMNMENIRPLSDKLKLELLLTIEEVKKELGRIR